MNVGSTNIHPDVESCRASCRSMGAGYFTYKKPPILHCWCKSANAGRKQVVGRVSGETCSGEINFPNHAFGKNSVAT